MHPSAVAFREAAAAEYGFDADVLETPDGTKTAADAADAVGCSLEQIVKSMVFSVDGDLVLVLTSGPNRVDEGALADAFDTTVDGVEPANPADVKEELGWSIGGVPPFCLERAIPTLMDETLRDHETVWAGAGTPNAVFPISPDRLGEFTDARVRDVFE